MAELSDWDEFSEWRLAFWLGLVEWLGWIEWVTVSWMSWVFRVSLVSWMSWVSWVIRMSLVSECLWKIISTYGREEGVWVWYDGIPSTDISINFASLNICRTSQREISGRTWNTRQRRTCCCRTLVSDLLSRPRAARNAKFTSETGDSASISLWRSTVFGWV